MMPTFVRPELRERLTLSAVAVKPRYGVSACAITPEVSRLPLRLTCVNVPAAGRQATPHIGDTP